MASVTNTNLETLFDVGRLAPGSSHTSFKSLLLKFLNQDKFIVYPLKEARIFSFCPLRITDDGGETFLEISHLEDEILNQFRSQGIDYEDGEFKIVLVEWEFIYCRVPNSQEHYFDIKSNRYRIEELTDEEEYELQEEGFCITEDIDVSIALGERQRRQLHREFKDTRKLLGIHSVTPIQDKTKKSFTYNKQLPQFSPYQSHISDTMPLDELSNIEYESASRSNGSNSHFMNILDVGQLVNADKIPIPNDQNLPPSPSVWSLKTPGSSTIQNTRVKKGFFSGAKKRGFGFQNLSLLGKRQFKEPSIKPVGLKDLSEAIMDGEVKWQDLKFGPEHIKYIKNHKKLLIDSLINDQ